jgi:hypothetical protein
MSVTHSASLEKYMANASFAPVPTNMMQSLLQQNAETGKLPERGHRTAPEASISYVCGVYQNSWSVLTRGRIGRG